MATLAERRVLERRSNVRAIPAPDGVEGLRVSWGGIWAGVLAATGVILLLTSLGVAVGITAADRGSSDPGPSGMGAGIWAAVTLLVALFLGGLVSTRIGAIFDRTTAIFQGAMVWIVSVLLTGYLAASGIIMIAAEMQPTAMRTAWVAFGALVLSLVAAVLGSAFGRRRRIPAESRPETARV